MRRVSSMGSVVMMLMTGACGGGAPAGPVAGAGDEAFGTLAAAILEDSYVRAPSQATLLGVHKYDDKLEDYSRAAVADEAAAARGFRAKLDAVDPATLSPDKQLDREFLRHAMDSRLLQLEVIKPWARDPDSYSSGVANSAYVIIKRAYAPADVRLRQLIAREKAMPAALLEARKNLDNPPQVYTEIALEQIEGSRDMFKTAVLEAFKDVKDAVLVAELANTNAAVIAAFDDYEKWLKADLLPRSKGEFAYGADTYHQRLVADEMIDTPLDELLRVAEADLQKNQAAFADTAKKIDPAKSARAVLAALQKDHPPADKLLATTQGELDALAQFLTDHHIITVPKAERARVQETPPFLRATTTASMDTPGPFEAVATEAFYSMTLPDPKWPAADQAEFMTQWYYAAITNVSVHEVWPGHYLQFLYAKQFPSDARKVFGAASNSEGWAHYGEQMVSDEGFHADQPKYRLAQLQDALLRDARFIVGIKMHTQGMTMPQAEAFFEKEGYQPAPVARSETKRGTNDATYGYYTMGKLMILKLREDYKAKMGAAYTLQGFHDAFIKLGPLPLPLIRKAMLGDVGKAF